MVIGGLKINVALKVAAIMNIKIHNTVNWYNINLSRAFSEYKKFNRTSSL